MARPGGWRKPLVAAFPDRQPSVEVERSASQFIVSVNVTPENVWYARTLM